MSKFHLFSFILSSRALPTLVITRT